MPILDPLSLPSTNQQQNERRLPARFYIEPVQNKKKSDEAGRPIFDDVEMINIMRPGDPTTDVHQEVTEKHKRQYPQEYAAFKQHGENARSGTPLAQLTFLTPRQIREFEAMNIFNVESLAMLDDRHAFMGWRDLKNKAVAYLELAKDQAAITRWEEEKKAMEVRAANQDSKIETLTNQVAQLIAKLGGEEPADPIKRAPGRPRKEAAEFNRDD